MAEDLTFRPRVQEAISFAARAHLGQFRKDGATPYIAHVLRVMVTASLEFGCQEEEVILAALLHDVLEDTAHDYDDLAERFSPRVANMVVSLTKDTTLPKKAREETYYAHLATCDWQTRLLKAADSLDNLREGIATGKRPKAAEKARKALELAHGNEPPLVKAREILSRTLEAEKVQPAA
jgi:(p)ppGpp synthase/HD superfamily hydrolase